MTGKEIMDSLSDALLSDERIFTPHEKELLANLLERVPKGNGHEHTLSEAVAAAVGETIARRAYALIGSNIAQRLSGSAHNGNPLYQGGPLPPSPAPGPPGPKRAETPVVRHSELPEGLHTSLSAGPLPPSPAPGPPGPKRAETPVVRHSELPEGLHTSLSAGPLPPSPAPGPPGPKRAETESDFRNDASAVAIAEEEDGILPAQCIVLDEFLAPAELESLLQSTVAREAEFQISEVVSPGATGGIVEFETRRSRVLMKLGPSEQLIANRIQSCLPRVLARLGHKAFPIARFETQITASNDGDFFRWHSDNGQPEIATRELTFVYFFHREPKAFRGGELRIYDSRKQNGSVVPLPNYRAVVPQQNQIVFFPSSLAHEITPIQNDSRAFVDSRFTVNGWLHR